MVIGLPRSGTTWAANWLCTDRTHCIHDALNVHHYADLDLIESGKILGVADTGLWAFPAWLEAHTARKVILHRNLDEIAASLESIGLPPIPPNAGAVLDNIEGMHIPWTDLWEWDKASAIYNYLTGLEFDAERHEELRQMNISPSLARVRRDKGVGRRLMSEIEKDWMG